MLDVMSLPINEIRFEHVQAFCAHQISEHTRLDYKSAMIDAQKIAKVVSAFANTQGGTIIFGVDEETNRKPVKVPSGYGLGNDPKQTVQNACAYNVFPPIVPEVSDFVPNPSEPTRGFLIVRVGMSEAVHAVDGRTGVYIRMNDQSEPQPADIDRLDWMLQRRNGGISLQEQRRAQTTEVLRGLLESDSKPGYCEVSLGPRLTADPMMDLRTLNAKAVEFSPHSLYHEAKFPIPDRHRMKAMNDAVYCVHNSFGGFGEAAGAMDVYGNISLIQRLRRRISKFHHLVDKDERKRFPIENDQPVSIEAEAAVEQLLCAIHAGSTQYSTLGFVGMCELTFHAPYANQTPLTRGNNFGDYVLGFCAQRATVSVRSLISTEQLAHEPLAALAPFVERVLWSWGSIAPNIVNEVIQTAARWHGSL